MTIASHCVELLRTHGPMTAAELGAACRFSQITKARDPALSVSSALNWHVDGRAIRLGDRYHLVTSLLEGRWLTFPAPVEPLAFRSVDLAVLRGPAAKDGVPISGGGTLRAQRGGSWRIDGHDAAEAELLGLRLTDGVAELSRVSVDGSAKERGERLAARLEASAGPQYRYAYRTSGVGQALLRLLYEDETLLREPIPPLSQLLPEPPVSPWQHAPIAAPPGHRRLALDLPDWLYGELEDSAASDGEPIGQWVTAELTRLARWPVLNPRRDDYFDPDAMEPTDIDGDWRQESKQPQPTDRAFGPRVAEQIDLRVVGFPQAPTADRASRSGP